MYYCFRKIYVQQRSAQYLYIISKFYRYIRWHSSFSHKSFYFISYQLDSRGAKLSDLLITDTYT